MSNFLVFNVRLFNWHFCHKKSDNLHKKLEIHCKKSKETNNKVSRTFTIKKSDIQCKKLDIHHTKSDIHCIQQVGQAKKRSSNLIVLVVLATSFVDHCKTRYIGHFQVFRPTHWALVHGDPVMISKILTGHSSSLFDSKILPIHVL